MEQNNTGLDIRAINEKIERESAFIDLLTMEMNKVIVGQKHMVERLLIGLLGQGHILLEGVPGLAKTLAINTGCFVGDDSLKANARKIFEDAKVDLKTV